VDELRDDSTTVVQTKIVGAVAQLPPLSERSVMPRFFKVIRSENYAYFVTCTVVEHSPLFADPQYAKIILDSLAFIREHKNIRLNAFVLMSTHIHAVLWPYVGINLSDVLRDFKRFTSRSISRLARTRNDQSNLDQFVFSRLSGRNDSSSDYQVWQDGSHPEAIYSDDFARQKIEYIHFNPVKAGLVSKAEDWPYSSARAYLFREPTYPPTDIMPLW
jgi:putative transposase